ncbi:transketolase [Finegoldia magna]|uniref:transketolase n=1 Tax=Finegoldia magna TaxID=1260 RepID=UPI000B91C9F7|nr:transketolase [Finegoldia magna]MDU2131283.1 transketolase [Finegoldia magna]MDU2220117.1 transketolase [Finegoldia magna]MDU4277155.1 transketolase [Finegoldia magna]MDU5069635.1 transketolase [Finegoldia magna]MDU6552481.1 transketolase [Finegoldia magna]
MDKKQLAINTIRLLSVEMIQKANSGHPGLPLGASPMTFTLFNDIMHFSPKHSDWINRDRFILSAGHGSAMLYSLLHLFGFGITVDDLKEFRQYNSLTPGHPEYLHTKGIDATTGPLGQGLSMAVGMAIAQEYMASQFNTENHKIFDNYTYTIVGDGCLQEGITNEASSIAGSLKLSKLICLYDSNNITIEGDTKNIFSENVRARYEALGWDTYFVEDGNDIDKIRETIELAKTTDKPSFIEIKTKIGYGSVVEGTAKAHGAPIGAENIPSLKEKLGLDFTEEFYIPQEVKELFEQSASEKENYYSEWEKMFEDYKQTHKDLYEKLMKFLSKETDEDYLTSDEFTSFEKDDATRSYSHVLLNRLKDKQLNIVGGSADLAPSNKTFMDGLDVFTQTNRSGRNIQFGVREHAMAAITNGISLYGGLIPYCATFMIFSDYLKPAMRLSALMKRQVIYILTHDSIGVGEDGPTHEPIEQLAMLRTIPNLNTIRPADGFETSMAYKIALENKETPTALVLSRQKLVNLKETNEEALRGGYILKKQESPDLVIIATGSEVKLALDASEVLEKEGVKAQVVSMMCQEIFDKQDQKYKDSVIPKNIGKRVSIECLSTYGWQKYTGLNGLNIGIDEFGMSAPGSKIMEHFGFTTEKIVEKIKEYL